VDSIDTLGRAGVAGDQIDGGWLAVGAAQARQDALDQMAGAALDQEDAGDRRLAAAEKIPHMTNIARASRAVAGGWWLVVCLFWLRFVIFMGWWPGRQGRMVEQGHLLRRAEFLELRNIL